MAAAVAAGVGGTEEVVGAMVLWCCGVVTEGEKEIRGGGREGGGEGGGEEGGKGGKGRKGGGGRRKEKKRAKEEKRKGGVVGFLEKGRKLPW